MTSTIPAFLILCTLGVGGCVAPESERCAWGEICAANTVCHEATQSCELPEALGACLDVMEGEACQYPGSSADTLCRDGVCISPRCGDGIADVSESCDGIDYKGATCESLSSGAYSGTLGCTADCRMDASGCGIMEWVALHGGTFQMGSATGEADEQPVHAVTVPDFEMSRSEITVAKFALCVLSGDCDPPGEGGHCNWGLSGLDQHPVNCVSWEQARDFCAFAGGRLPSEAEWEYAARSQGGAQTYPWGDAAATCSLASMDDGGGPGCGTGETLPVCSRPSGNTAQGLCDMAGNVWEWVQDHYQAGGYAGAPTDGSAWEVPGGDWRARHGGAYITAVENLRASNRNGDDPLRSEDWLGFRCAR